MIIYEINLNEMGISNGISFNNNSFLVTDQHESLFKNEYIVISMYLFLAILLSLIFILISYFLVIQKSDIEKMSSYECGFEPYEDARNKYNVKFYLIAILFVLFDIETMFLLPFCVSASKLNLLGFWSMIDFIIELGVGYIYIWWAGSMEWE